ncbi:MAG: type II toxin-antitoxin system HicB family antitoxin [Phycisphaerales bacterium]|nr:type II toxin-antitoxin system HicB family antitoxin [Phycisphaerales bacterium]
MKKYAVIYEPAADGGNGAYVPDLPGCVAVGQTIEEARALIREAGELHLSGIREDDPSF